MMSDYTPSVDNLRAEYASMASLLEHLDGGTGPTKHRLAEFDRVIAKVKAEALREAADALDNYNLNTPIADDERWTCDLGYYGEAAWLRARAKALTNSILSPECDTQQHRSCDGRAFDLDSNETEQCQCSCHP